MSGWKDSAADSMGGKEKKPKKVIHEIRTRKAKSGGYVHEHHHTRPDVHPSEEHVSGDQEAMLAHMAQAMPGPSAAPAPDADASAAAPDASAAGAAPAAAPAPAAPGM